MLTKNNVLIGKSVIFLVHLGIFLSKPFYMVQLLHEVM